MENERDYEVEAKAGGWVPEEEWRGDKDQWRPAQDFVERGEKIIPILKDQIKNLRNDLDMTIKANEAQVTRATEEAYESAKTKYQTKVKELEKQEIAAVAEGDTTAYLEVKSEKDNLKAPDKPVVKQGPTPEFKEWSGKNPWYGTDNAMTLYSEAFAKDLSAKNPNMPFEKVWEEIAKEVKKEFPHKFQNMRRNEAGSVESGTTEPGQSGGNKFADLPASAKSQFKRLERQFKLQGRVYKKEIYAADWHAQS